MRWFPAVLGKHTVVRLFLVAQLAIAVVAPVLRAAETSPDPAVTDSIRRGRAIYLQKCVLCHQMKGEGVPGIYPPLARSSYLTPTPDRAIQALCEGLNGEVEVNGRTYAGAMPPQLLDDAGVADVLTFVLQSWGNAGPSITPEQVRDVRAKSAYPTFEKLQASMNYPALPPANGGLQLRELLRLPFRPVRLTPDASGKGVYILGQNGDVWHLDATSARLRQILWGDRYREKREGDLGGPLFILAMALDPQGRLLIGANQQNGSTKPFQNIITIYRTTSMRDGQPAEPKPWFQTNYHGNAAYVHGLENIAFGPDGFLYAGNGARTDAGQTGDTGDWYGGGETPITSSIWRLDPRAEHPQLEIFARGVRNPYGFCWNERGEMFASENGPDADAPEELNWIRPGRHYGFPYRFGSHPAKDYAGAPAPPAPEGLQFTDPVVNLGPDGGFEGTPISTFDPHSCPGGIVHLGANFPEPLRDSFLMPRFGNFIRSPKPNSGFDLLRIRLKKGADGEYAAEVKSLFTGLGRPIDICVLRGGRILVGEYTRATDSTGSQDPSGRIVELLYTPTKTASTTNGHE